MTDPWADLAAHRTATRDRRIEALFTVDPARAERCTLTADGLHFDWSRTAIDDRALTLLLELAQGVPARRDAMFAGERINETEDRAVLHTALRRREGPVLVDGQDVMRGVLDTLARMKDFAADVRAGRFKGQGGAITDVVNIGIGGRCRPVTTGRGCISCPTWTGPTSPTPCADWTPPRRW